MAQPAAWAILSPVMQLSLIIPAYNEEEAIPLVHEEASAELSRRFARYEIIFVDDGSTDRTSERILAARAKDAHVRHVRLPRNRGKSAAYSAGFALATGELIATMDADLQDDISELPKLMEKLEAGTDLVIGRKVGRLKNEPLKALPSLVFNVLLYIFFGLRLHDFNCGFRVMRREVTEALSLYGGFYRFIPALAHIKGFSVDEVGVNHRKRRHGHSKYGLTRFWTGLLDLFAVRFVTAYIERPLHVFGTVSLVAGVAGFGLEIYVLTCKFIMGETFQMHVAAIIIGAILIMVAVQVFTIGLVGSMLAAHMGRREAAIEQVSCKGICPVLEQANDAAADHVGEGLVPSREAVAPAREAETEPPNS